jgi:hypothetical protein
VLRPKCGWPTTSSSESEGEEPADTAGQQTVAHTEVCLRLLTFLDCTANAAATSAWDMLAGSLLLLLRAGEAGRQAARAAFDPDRRQTWWFATHAHLAAAQYQRREPRCLAKQLTVFDLLVGPAHPLSRQLETLLSRWDAGVNDSAETISVFLLSLEDANIATTKNHENHEKIFLADPY